MAVKFKDYVLHCPENPNLAEDTSVSIGDLVFFAFYFPEEVKKNPLYELLMVGDPEAFQRIEWRIKNGELMRAARARDEAKK